MVLRRGWQQALEGIVFDIQRVGQILLDLGARVRIEMEQTGRSNAVRLACYWGQRLQRLKASLLEYLFAGPVSLAVQPERKGL